MKPEEAINFLVSIALSFMNQIGEENQPKVLEARKVLRGAIKPKEPEKKEPEKTSE